MGLYQPSVLWHFGHLCSMSLHAGTQNGMRQQPIQQPMATRRMQMIHGSREASLLTFVTPFYPQCWQVMFTGSLGHLPGANASFPPLGEVTTITGAGWIGAT